MVIAFTFYSHIDVVGIPRLIVLNGNEERMVAAGWKYCNSKSLLGDNSVQLGSRVAYVYGGKCSIWEEQSLQEEESRSRKKGLG